MIFYLPKTGAAGIESRSG